MRAVIQRVSEASVEVEGEVVGVIGPGLLVLVGVAHDDGSAEAEVLSAKIAGLRIFPDDDGKMNRSLVESGGKVLVVSQFTLYADTTRGRRPSFVGAASPAQAEPLIQELRDALRERGLSVETGRFGERMAVKLVNDGPVTIIVEVSGGRVVN
ncbi:MAG TPA: D-aminoacyl-tRNA deacylase [Acidimicrobiia bacterium]|nr:D-aminoacyl-tRNA deacylase [Acidimicrobiia bacterium]